MGFDLYSNGRNSPISWSKETRRCINCHKVNDNTLLYVELFFKKVKIWKEIIPWLHGEEGDTILFPV